MGFCQPTRISKVQLKLNEQPPTRAGGTNFTKRWLAETSATVVVSGRMHWIAPSEKDSAAAALEKRLWDAADQFRAKIQNLRRTRDLLLPRLLSGQVNLPTN